MPITGYSDPVFDAIKTFLTGAWTDTAILWPNEEGELSGVDPMLKVEIHGTVYGQQSIGANLQADNRWDDEGTLWLYLLVPRGTGLSHVRGAAMAIANLFRGLTLLSGSLEFMDANIGIGTSREQDGPWYVVPVSIEWRHIDA